VRPRANARGAFFKKSLARLGLPYQAHSASEQYESQRGPLWVKNCRAILRDARPLCPRKLPRQASAIGAVKCPFIFVSERDAPFSVSGLQKMIERAGIAAKMPFKCHPHMLRHATGYALANNGTDTRTLQSYLGHRSIQSTVRYTELAPGRFKNLWR